MQLMPDSRIDILLVDDDDIDREAVRRLLPPGYAVREAPTGHEALRMAQTRTPSCVLLDYRLPDMDGLHLLPEFTRAYIPVIVLTGEESPEVIVQAMQQGAQDYLVKAQLSRIALEHALTNAIEKVGLKRHVEEKNRQVRELASALTLAEQRERQRISQVLHDHVQQMLYGIQMRSQLIGLDTPPSSVLRDHLKAMEQLVNDAIRATRTLAVELSPPVLQSEGLAAALEWLAQNMAELHGLQVATDLRADCRKTNNDLCVLLFQLVRELLFNVVKHAGVQRAELTMWEQDEHLVVCVADNGCGFEVDIIRKPRDHKGGFGLYSVSERLLLFGGRLEIESQPGHGVRATIIVPQATLIPALA
jgi:signal transduction histidine kinase